MSRTAQASKISKLYLAMLVVVALVGGGLGLRYQLRQTSQPAKSPASQTVPTTQLSYRGQDGKNALELLKTKAKVRLKSSSLGDYVVAINGNDGGGKKYWIYYINGKEAAVVATSYVTKNTDNIIWKLQ